MKLPAWVLFVVAAAVTVLLVMSVMIARSPVPELEGTAPSVVTDSTGSEARRIGSVPEQQDARDKDASSTAGRAARDSGVEGVTSGGITSAPAR